MQLLHTHTHRDAEISHRHLFSWSNDTTFIWYFLITFECHFVCNQRRARRRLSYSFLARRRLGSLSADAFSFPLARVLSSSLSSSPSREEINTFARLCSVHGPAGVTEDEG